VSAHDEGLSDLASRPEPDAPGKPTGLHQISARSWSYVVRRTVREFLRDDGLDLAAGLTYYAVLAVFPALIALVSLLGVLGQGPESVATILEVARRLVPEEALSVVQPVIEGLASSTAASLALVLGLLGALWFVSGYISAFGRAMNRIYEVPEGRPLPRLLGTTAAVTLLLGLLALCAILLLLISGPVARALGDVLGLGSEVLLLWGALKWPALALILAVVIAVLYHVTPNVRQPRFRWLSPGAALAIAVWLGGSLGFGLYVANFSNYSATYGSLAGGIVFLVWLWVSNLALLVGAELDAEIERVRELQAGIAAEERLQLPPRDIRGSVRAQAQHDADVRAARALRQQHAPEGADRPAVSGGSGPPGQGRG
jgi:membrane protein